jgi:phosphatidylglycerol---prolipoprotein diacylglyceryl transferase
MASLPHIHIPSLDLGPVDLQPFGILVASGVLLATWMARKYSERNGLDEDTTRYMGIRVLVWGFIACHIFNTIFYEWDRFQEDPLLMLKVWDGISSWGGVIGGGLALYIYTGIKKLDRLRWGDWAAYAAIGGWVPGRLACAVVHDHLGYPTDSPLGVDFPPKTYKIVEDGILVYQNTDLVRAHDLGLLEFLILVPIFIAIVLLERWKGRKPGFLLGFLAVAYSVPRFFLEFMRRPEADPRYYGLTFAQYACILALIAGVMLLRRRPRAEPLPEAVVEPSSASRPAGAKKPGQGQKKKRKK